jgi:choline-sulfatase
LNILLIMSDEHSKQAMGYAGHNIVRTPNLDCLASEGACFTNCYSTSPLCSPARASFFTGLYANRLGVWDNALSYDGQVEGMSHCFLKNKITFGSYGKWDFHPNGNFPGLEQNVPRMRSNPQYEACFRDTDIKSPGGISRFNNIGSRTGGCFDDLVLDGALNFLETMKNKEEPWILYTGFFHPHFPFKTTENWWKYYEDRVKDIPETAKGPFDYLAQPLKKLHGFFYGDEIGRETVLRAHIGYYALISELDTHIGILLEAIERHGMDRDTLVIYTSDHGEQLGHHGLWWKCCMYEESTNVPLIMRGPGISPGTIIDEPVSLVDIYPTICKVMGLPLPQNIDGNELFSVATGESKRPYRDYAFSEYHGHGMESAAYMIRWKEWKYVYYVDYGVQLFNIEKDPNELTDLAVKARVSPEISKVLVECEKRLRHVCDPEDTDKKAKADQMKIRAELKRAGFNKNNYNIHSLPEPPRPGMNIKS